MNCVEICFDHQLFQTLREIQIYLGLVLTFKQFVNFNVETEFCENRENKSYFLLWFESLKGFNTKS